MYLQAAQDGSQFGMCGLQPLQQQGSASVSHQFGTQIPDGLHILPPPQSAFVAQLHSLVAATALLAKPKQASAIPARPTPNFFSAPRRVTD